MPTISVIVPVYKVEPYLKRCVNSILGQTFTDFELILVDDGSPDNCSDICDEYAEIDCRVHVIHQENGGPSSARNAGIDWVFVNSDSQWISFVDSDDWIHPKYLEQLLNAAVENDVAVSICTFLKTDGGILLPEEEHFTIRRWQAETLYVEHNIFTTIPCGKLYQKNCFEQIRFPMGKIHEDEFVIYRILFDVKELVMIEEPLYAYYENQAGITKSQWIPRRLDSVDAIANQVCYMKQHKYVQGFRYALKKYCLNISYQMNALQNCDNIMQREYTSLLRKKLRKALCKYPKVISFAENKWVYELAFPRMMCLYWMINSQIDKIIRKE